MDRSPEGMGRVTVGVLTLMCGVAMTVCLVVVWLLTGRLPF